MGWDDFSSFFFPPASHTHARRLQQRLRQPVGNFNLNLLETNTAFTWPNIYRLHIPHRQQLLTFCPQRVVFIILWSVYLNFPCNCGLIRQNEQQIIQQREKVEFRFRSIQIVSSPRLLRIYHRDDIFTHGRPPNDDDDHRQREDESNCQIHVESRGQWQRCRWLMWVFVLNGRENPLIYRVGELHKHVRSVLEGEHRIIHSGVKLNGSRFINEKIEKCDKNDKREKNEERRTQQGSDDHTVKEKETQIFS